MKVSVIVPAYNEVRTLAPCVRAALERNRGLDLEVLIVDDGSTDGTGESWPGAWRARRSRS